MSWSRGEEWLDTDMLWFRERRPAAALAVAVNAPSFFGLPAAEVGAPPGLAASRRRRSERDRRRKRTRAVPAVAAAVGSAAVLPLTGFTRGGGTAERILFEDPPSLTFNRAALGGPASPPSDRTLVKSPLEDATPAIDWNHAVAVGLPYAGHLHDGTRLPVAGPDWVTWNPATDRSPNLPGRLYGTEQTVRTILSVIEAYRAAHPAAPRVVIGDISFAGGGPMDQHVSHQNGRDVDVYYPRHDKALSAPTRTAQINRRLAQDLVDRFVAAGAQKIFVGYATGLRGPGDVVTPYPNHENHMHVRFAPS
jgi:murein endopeptidase